MAFWLFFYLCKFLEKLLTVQMVKFFETNGLFNPNQFAYRKDRSTVEAMLLLHELWMNSIDEKEQSIMMSIDLSSTFDSVNHTLLLRKLEV